jgi:serine protease
LQQLADRLQALGEVEYAEPDYMLQHAREPSDPRYSEQWHYSEQFGINTKEAWDRNTGTNSVVAAVLDTGITAHADLANRIIGGYDFVTDTDRANDGDGRDADPSDPGDWVTSAEATNMKGKFWGCEVADSSWHGTHVAGTLGAATDNALGVAGLNWHSRILSVRVLGKCGGTISDIADGIRWAAGLGVSGVPANSNPASVINISLGARITCGTTLQNSINDAVSADVTVVVAAGNGNEDAAKYAPASCAGVITVAATNRSGNRASYSNFGSTVEISAPGGETRISLNDGVLSTLNTGTQGPVADTYVFYQGTSMATPHVTGLVSLLHSINPSLTPAAVLQVIKSTAKSFPKGSICSTSDCGAGILDAGAAVQMVQMPAEMMPLLLLLD